MNASSCSTQSWLRQALAMGVMLGCSVAMGANAGCAVGEQTAEETSQASETPLAGNPRARWQNPGAIPICFINRDGSGPTEQAVKNVVTSEYAKAGLCFTGWGRCDASTPCPAIRLLLDRPANAPDGVAGQSYVGPVTWDCNYNNSTIWTDSWDWAIIHEIGHGVGLHHEFARTDNNGKCDWSRKESIPQGGDATYVTTYDENSVMSLGYCHGQKRLSPLDVEGIKAFYGTQGGVCGGSSGGGGGDLPVGQTVRIRSAVSNKVIDISNYSHDAGATIWQWDWLNGSNQKWRIERVAGDDVRVVSLHNGQCLDVPWGSAEDGVGLIQWPCHDNPNQRFRFEKQPDGSWLMKNVLSNKCVDVTWFSQDNAAIVQQWGCHGEANQRWYIEAAP